MPDDIVQPVVPQKPIPVTPPTSTSSEDAVHQAIAAVESATTTPQPPSPQGEVVMVPPPEPEPVPVIEEVVETPKREISVRTFENDMARAMNVSDAKTVQELLTNARARESLVVEKRTEKSARGWYTAGSIILLLVAIVATGYSAYHYSHLTVPVTETASVGVFPTTDPIVASTTSPRKLFTALGIDDALTDQKPYLVNLVSDATTQTLLSNQELFSFIGAPPTEPLSKALYSVRLGVMNTPGDSIPFIIASVNDLTVVVKELLIAEPTLLPLFARGLQIDLSTLSSEINPPFVGEYRYNLPVRTLYMFDTQGVRKLVLLYAPVTDNVVVITTDPSVLKAVYDTIMRQ